jgi:hypothetical protein
LSVVGCACCGNFCVYARVCRGPRPPLLDSSCMRSSVPPAPPSRTPFPARSRRPPCLAQPRAQPHATVPALPPTPDLPLGPFLSKGFENAPGEDQGRWLLHLTCGASSLPPGPKRGLPGDAISASVVSYPSLCPADPALPATLGSPGPPALRPRAARRPPPPASAGQWLGSRGRRPRPRERGPMAGFRRA